MTAHWRLTLFTLRRSLVLLAISFALLGQIPTPTQAGSPIVSFAATGGDKGVHLTWKTGFETQAAGFNLYRSARPDGPFVKINPDLIPAHGDAIAGGTYVYDDAGAVAGLTYYYALDLVQQDGQVLRHGPVPIALSAAPWTMNTLALDVELGVGLVSALAVLALIFMWHSHRAPRGSFSRPRS